jgi:hypothetical protein
MSGVQVLQGASSQNLALCGVFQFLAQSIAYPILSETGLNGRFISVSCLLGYIRVKGWSRLSITLQKNVT